MSTFTRRIRPHVAAELEQATLAESRGEQRRAFAHLERAHVLGQASTALHVQVHLRSASACSPAGKRGSSGGDEHG